MFPEDDPLPAHQQFPEPNCLTPNRPCRGTFREACPYSNGACTKGLSPLERVRDGRIPSRPPLDATFNSALPTSSGSRANRRAIRAVVVGRVTRSAVDFTTDHYKSNHITSLYATASCTTSVLLHTPSCRCRCWARRRRGIRPREDRESAPPRARRRRPGA